MSELCGVETALADVTLVRPKSRGRVSLRSSDPFTAPIIDPQYLSHPDDIKVFREGIQNLHSKPYACQNLWCWLKVTSVLNRRWLESGM